jgi:N-acetylneuraminate synthase
LSRAKEIVRAVAASGATAVKFQTYTASTMTLDSELFRISDDHPLWGGRKLFDLYEEAHTPWEWHAELFELATSLNLTPFSSPFDKSAVDFLEDLNTSMYKIASMETGDLSLIRYVAEKGKPVIMSTGASTLSEIEDAVQTIRNTGNDDITLLLCTSSYPSKPSDAHLNRMKLLSDKFECKIGLSDHTLGIGVSVAAIALGATAIEKHVTLRRKDGGADGAFSMEPQEFTQLVSEGLNAWSSVGEREWKIQTAEAESRNLRRTLYITEDVKAGEVVTELNLRCIRPGGGLPGKYYEELVGKKFINSHSKGTPMQLDFVI